MNRVRSSCQFRLSFRLVDFVSSSNMRSDDLRVGNPYALAGHRKRKVTVLETPPELRRRARVRVRFENGVKAGEEGEVPTRRISAPWDGSSPSRSSRSAKSALALVDRPPVIGDEVAWNGDRRTWIWTVEEIDESKEEATISTVMLERRTTQTVPVDQLAVRVDVPRSSPALDHLFEPPSSDEPEKGSAESIHEMRAWAAEHLRPERPRRQVEVLLDDIFFSSKCLSSYRKRYALRLSGTALSDHLTSLIRGSGSLLFSKANAPEYARIRVPGHFDVVLRSAPTADNPVIVEHLSYFSRRRSKGRSKGPSRRPRRKRQHRHAA